MSIYVYLCLFNLVDYFLGRRQNMIVSITLISHLMESCLLFNLDGPRLTRVRSH